MSNKYPGGIITSGANAGYSVAFDGTGDYLTIADNAAFNLATGAWTIEAFVYFNTVASRQVIIGKRVTTSPFVISWYLEITASAQVQFTNAAGSSSSAANVVKANTWGHIAASYDGTNLSLYYNGTRVFGPSAVTNNDSTANIYIGGSTIDSFYLNGWASNVRVVKGTALYSGATINVPTQLFKITNTSLLTCNSPAIVDQSSNAFSITANGNAAVSTFTPFQGYVAYNPALGAATPGIWSVSDAIQAAQTRRWNMYDPYFNLTTLLLHGNGTNGAQNNTFLDSSSNNFTITRNGNTTQGTFSPFSQTGWSNYFSSSSYLSIASNAAFGFGTGNYTMEAWIYSTVSITTNSMIIDFRNSTPASGQPVLYISSSAKAVFYLETDANLITGTTTINPNTWYHIAISKNSGTYTLYVNGVSEGTSANSRSVPTSGVRVGNDYAATGQFTGYISNARITNTAVYTGAFTPSTTSLTAVTGTQLLTCQSNRFIDNSSNAYAITVSGTPSVQAFSPFYPVVAYTPQAQGGSGYFDGTGDYLTAPNNTALDLSSGDFTVEVWFYPTQANQSGTVVNRHNGNYGSGNDFQFSMYMSSGSLVVRPYQGTGDFSITAGTPQRNGWNHAALVRTGNTFYGFLNGVRSGTSQTITGALNNSTWATYIGAALASTGNDFFTGYMGGVRITKGGALYTGSTYTVPTSPFTTTVSSGTVSLLTNFTNAGIIDSTGDNVLETVGNASISTTQSKFGGSSMYFDGTGDYLVLPDSPSWYLGNTFTIEAWIYPISTSGYKTICAHVTSGWYFSISSGRLESYDFTVNKAVNSATSSISTNVWQHVALVCNAGTAQMYINGTASGTAVTGYALSDFSGLFYVGEQGTNNYVFNGYIEELRITKGIARYTGNFTPQTSQWQDQ